MAKKGNNDFFSSLRTAGIRKRVAKALSELESSGREAGGNAEKLARRAIDDLRGAADAIEKRLNIGSGAKKRSSTRKRTTTKRRSPAKKAARKTTARKSPARKTTARKTTARKSTARKSTARKAPARKTTARKSTARKTTARKRS